LTGDETAEMLCDQGDAGALMAAEREEDAARRATKGFEIICWVAVPIEHHAVGHGFFLSYSLLNFSHAHGRGGEVENDMPVVSRRYAEGHGMGADDTFHTSIQSRGAGTDADRAHGDHSFAGRHLHVVRKPSAMTGAAEGYYTDAMLLGFSVVQLHRHVSRRLADIVVAFDDGSNFPFPYYLRPFAKVDCSVLDPCQIGSNPSDTVAGIAAQIGLDE